MSLWILATSIGCDGAKARDPAPRPVPVSVQAAFTTDVPLEIEANGNVAPIATIAVKSRVDGQIERAFFKEGEYVKQGDPLFLLDSRPYRLALSQLQANLARDEVVTRNAELEERRTSSLVAQKLISQQEYDQKATQVASLRATLEADRSAVDNAKVNLSYTRIAAPISGRTGSLQITSGNLVKANTDPPLVVIRQISPIYVGFAVPADRLPEIRRNSEKQPLEVQAHVPSEATSARGELTFIDNSIDTATGTIALKATFANADRQLWPGQFVDVKLRLSSLQHAVVVPAHAIMTGQRGDQAFVVNEKLVADARQVKAGMRFGNLVVVEHGIKSGEQVVTDGQMNLMPGTRVEIKAALDKPEEARQ